MIQINHKNIDNVQDNEYHIDVNINDKVIRIMQTYGNSFVQSLAELWMRGNKDERKKLEEAFSFYFTFYVKLADLR